MNKTLYIIFGIMLACYSVVFYLMFSATRTKIIKKKINAKHLCSKHLRFSKRSKSLAVVVDSEDCYDCLIGE